MARENTMIDGENCRVIEKWRTSTTSFVLGYSENMDMFYVRACEDAIPHPIDYYYEYENLPTKEMVIDEHIIRLASDSIEKHEMQESENEYTLHIKYDPPYDVNGVTVSIDSILFSSGREVEDYIKGKVAYDHLDNAVQKCSREVLLYVENKDKNVIWCSAEHRENIANNLAVRIDEFVWNYDPYEYSDRVDNREEEVINDKEMLLRGNYGPFRNTLNDVIENESEDDSLGNAAKAKELLDKIEQFDERFNNRKGLGYELYIAAKRGEVNTVRELIDKGADVNYVFYPEEHRYTPLHIAAYLASEKVVALLLERGCKVNPISADGKTPLALVKEYHNIESIISLMERYGASDGSTPIPDYAKVGEIFLSTKNKHFLIGDNGEIIEFDKNRLKDAVETRKTLEQLNQEVEIDFSHGNYEKESVYYNFSYEAAMRSEEKALGKNETEQESTPIRRRGGR